MNIAFVRPNMGNYRASDAMPPLALGILSARTTGHRTFFYDDRVESIPERIDADLVAMSVETFTARRAYQLAGQFRGQGAAVVMGGFHPTLLPHEASQYADAIIIGDAEGSWERVVDDMAKGCLKKIYRGDNQAELSGCTIDRTLFTNKAYAPIELIQYGRGCRYSCDFCSIHSYYGSRVRIRPIAEVQQEIEGLSRKHLLFFVDDNLFSTKGHLEQLLAMLQPLQLRWSCQMSIDAARNPEVLDKLAAAGCRFVLIGFENLDVRNLKQMNKAWNNAASSYHSVVDALHQRGIGIYGTFIFGYDFDTTDTIKHCLDFALEARLEIANFNPLTPTPGSGLYNRLLHENRLIHPTWWIAQNYRYGDPIFIPRSMRADELTTACFEAKKNFYAWSSIARRLWPAIKPLSLFDTTVTGIANLISRREVYKKQGLRLGEDTSQ